MVNELGKFLRKIRIDYGEILKNMADKLEVTSSFLSAVENGKKKMPSSWYNKIIELYKLDDNQVDDFNKAIAKTEESVEISLRKIPDVNKEVAISFARKFQDFNTEDIEQIQKILKGVKKR